MSARKATRRPKAVAEMIAQMKSGKRPKHLDEYAAVADHFGVPPWVMFIPNLPKEMLEEHKLKDLVQHMECHIAVRDLAASHPLTEESCLNVLSFLQWTQPDPGVDYSKDERLRDAYTLLRTWVATSLQRGDVDTYVTPETVGSAQTLNTAILIGHLLSAVEPMRDEPMPGPVRCGQLELLSIVNRALEVGVPFQKRMPRRTGGAKEAQS